MNKLEELRFNLQEKRYPYFSEDELKVLLNKNNQDVKAASYEGLLIKAENTGISVSGLKTSDSSRYFRMLASRFAKTNSGVLK